jgi:very-short-patch-repair endonuclease
MKGQGFYRRGAGFKVLPQATEGEFRIDLAVVHPSEQRYAIGIKCDGATYHSSWTAQSHDIWGQKVLKSCGWKIYRIWSTDWWRDPKTQIDALLETVGRACSSSIL